VRARRSCWPRRVVARPASGRVWAYSPVAALSLVAIASQHDVLGPASLARQRPSHCAVARSTASLCSYAVVYISWWSGMVHARRRL
jgi:hypothetical protein